jgi:ParB-like chromosome segregation protein Spo0J
MVKAKSTKVGKRRKGKRPAGHSGLTIECVPVKRIKLATYNPRKKLSPGDLEYQQIKRSLEEFEYVESLVWNKRTGNLVAGHQRLRILIDEMGTTAVDVSVVDLPLDKEKTLNLALNKLRGRWDDAALATLLAELSAKAGGSLAATGFTDREIEALALENTVKTELKPIDTRPPPKMSWVLIGIPTVRFGRLGETLTKIGRMKGVVLETTVNDG